MHRAELNPRAGPNWSNASFRLFYVGTTGSDLVPEHVFLTVSMDAKPKLFFFDSLETGQC